MKVYAALAKGLKEHGVDHLFGLLGDANLFMAYSYVNDEGGRYFDAAHESGATLMAMGYAQRSGRVGIVSTTHGPAVTNTTTALTEATRNRVPMVLMAGATPDSGRLMVGGQWINQREVILPTGAGYEPLTSVQTALRDLSLAIRRAYIERRPIVLDIQANLLWEDVEYQHVPNLPVWEQVPRPDLDALDEAGGILASSRNPLILMGRGVTPEARASVLQLAERIGAPVATSLGGKGHLTGEQFGIGIFGTLSSPVGNETIQAADCIFAFGASLNMFTTDGGSLLKDKAVIQCDINALNIGLHYPVNVGVVGDAGAVAKEMIELLDEADIKPKAFRSPELAEQLAQATAHVKELSGDTPIDIDTMAIRLDAALPKQRTLLFDGGRWMEHPFKYVDVPSARSWNYTLGFGSIGLGFATAIGAGIAAEGEPVAFFCGDGSFMHAGITEFNTAVRHKVDMITVVANDGAYGAEHVLLRGNQLDPKLSTFPWPDFAPVADALGGRGVTVRTVADLDEAEEAIRDRDRPLLIDVKLDPDQVPNLTIPGGRHH
jgi:thiamine pyrophosphate-dependent acetolactate synthase large subunit-like protein